MYIQVGINMKRQFTKPAHAQNCFTYVHMLYICFYSTKSIENFLKFIHIIWHNFLLHNVALMYINFWGPTETIRLSLAGTLPWHAVPDGIEGDQVLI